MPCLICRYFQPTEPAEHKAAREAGTCESRCGKEWNNHTALRVVKNHGGTIEGWCRRHPEAKHVKHGYYCGDISVFEYFYNHSWGVDRITPDQGLAEWAGDALTTVLHGNRHANWSAQRNNALEAQNKELRRQLQQARKISASRLERLQKADTKKVESKEPEPFVPRLVAAE